MLAGEEMLRSKPTTATNDYDNSPAQYKTDRSYYFSENSYKSPDSVNAINWNDLDENADMVAFYKELIAIKKTFPQFSLKTREQVRSLVTISDRDRSEGVAMYTVKDPESDMYAIVLYNATAAEKTLDIPKGEYDVHVLNGRASASEPLEAINGSSVKLDAYSSAVLVGELKSSAVDIWAGKVGSDEPRDGNIGLAVGLGVGIPAAILATGGATAAVLLRNRKKKSVGGKDNDGADEDAPDATLETPDAPKEDTPDTPDTPEETSDAPSGEGE